MRNFVYESLPGRVVFGSEISGSTLEREIRNLGCSRVLIVTGPRQAQCGEDIQKSIASDLFAGIYSNATMHTPIEVTNQALTFAKQVQADCVLSIGGGSAIGLGKALALHSNGQIRHIAMPTTYAGSECTPIIGQTVNGQKTTQRSWKVLPQTIIYDVTLSADLPYNLSVTSGLNAMAHAIEALYSHTKSPITDTLALQGIATMSGALSAIKADPASSKARSDALYATYLCGHVLGSVGMSLHHKLCHVLGGSFNMPHSETHTIVLPHAIEYNTPYCIPEMRKVAHAIGSTNAAQGVFDLVKRLGGPLALRDLGLKEEELDQAVELAVATPYPNPAPFEKFRLRRLLQAAWEGQRPAGSLDIFEPLA